MKITDNITVTGARYGHYEVKDNANGVSVNVPAWIVDDCDTDDQESVEKCLALLRNAYKRATDDPHYNILVQETSEKDSYWYGGTTGTGVDPLTYADAWPADDVLEELRSVKEKYMNACTEEVEPFEF